ncbi:T9SS C-terminal target domain-containing protein [Chryseobacterium phosphatilyticum]|uniref:T9SS C-terminal target domain-containing protein n=1 Tax=Chryseobacterium phosphatilyticum TaxID=475075 RepID=A0A316XGD2_9FLAO|nr:zinc-dependent metalloprotease [Chryseobacterium phosphatilyticum]PWN69840.1 T9SS C-terminal target domain-containing protein [Chryseobacterium phosphatilyticum]
MKRITTVLGVLLCINAFSQVQERYCGFDEDLRSMDARFPELKKRREEVEQKLRNIDKQSYLNKVGGGTSWNGLYAGQVYEIPVVVHVIESNATANANLKLTDQQIKDWIDRANKMYATTYGNGFYPEGPGVDGGNVVPFKLVLAKRNPQCTATTGIVRYNGSTLTSYDTSGVKQGASGSGASDADIKTLAPHWPETSYFNIYVVIGFNGQQQSSGGLMGYARFPETYDYFYESFMKVATITNQNDTTLTHELGHSFGLYHTFQGGNYAAQSGTTGYCPPAQTDCTVDNDKVCDTEVSGAAYYQFPAPSNSAINPCTGVNYQGVQYNIMNYSNTNRKFTAGQRDRAIMLMMEYRKNLLNSTAGQDPSVVVPSPVTIAASQCNPTGTAHPTNNNFAIGPTKVQFGGIASMTNGYDSDEPAPKFYEDYAAATCIRPAYYTDIPMNTSTDLKVYLENGFSQAEKFKTKVWIDYNNNGSFEEAELVINNTSATAMASGAGTTVTAAITPPAGAVTDTYLRMRVAVDAATYGGTTLPDITPCSQLQYGQMEDYAVKLVGSLGTSDSKNNAAESKLVYLKSENKLKLGGNKNEIFGDYQIYDLSGKLIQKGNSKTNEVQIERELPKGAFIINYSDKTKKESKKFLNN